MWIFITRTVPVLEDVRPMIYGIYQAQPLEHEFHENAVTVFTTDKVTVLEHEYSVITEERVAEYVSMGWTMNRIEIPNQPIDMRLLEKGRYLCEEERDIIRALMLDGLTEYQACEEYYKHSHTEIEKMSCFYAPPKEMVKQMEQVFGRR